MRTAGGGTVAGDQAAYDGGHLSGAAPTRAVQPFASWLVSYQRYAYLRGTLLGVILLGGLVVMIVRRRGLGGLPWAFAVTILLVPPLVADFDLRYLVPAVPIACLAAALAFAPRPSPVDQRRWTTLPAATGSTVPDEERTRACRPGPRRRPARRAPDRRGVRPGSGGRSCRTARCNRPAARSDRGHRRPGTRPVPAFEAAQDSDEQRFPFRAGRGRNCGGGRGRDCRGGRGRDAKRRGRQRARACLRELAGFGGHVEADADHDHVAGRLGEDSGELRGAGEHVVRPFQPRLDSGHGGHRRGDAPRQAAGASLGGRAAQPPAAPAGRTSARHAAGIPRRGPSGRVPRSAPRRRAARLPARRRGPGPAGRRWSSRCGLPPPRPATGRLAAAGRGAGSPRPGAYGWVSWVRWLALASGSRFAR